MKITRKNWLEGHMRSCFFRHDFRSAGDALFSAEICVCSRRNTVRLRLVFQRRIKLPAARRSMKKNLCEFPDAVYFPDRGRLFSVCNLGSSCGKYDFDYSKFNHSGSATDAGINLASAPQSLLYDLNF